MAGVKNLRWHLVHEAIAGTLPTYLTTTKLRSAMAGTQWHVSVGVPMARLGYDPKLNAYRYTLALALYSKRLTVAEATMSLLDAGFTDEAFGMTRTLVDT